jgi:hypothetical protein
MEQENPMSLQEALKVFATAFQAFHDRRTTGKTAHNAVCVGVHMSLFPEEGSALNGTI